MEMVMPLLVVAAVLWIVGSLIYRGGKGIAELFSDSASRSEPRPPLSGFIEHNASEEMWL
jgi:hypothetical protein